MGEEVWGDRNFQAQLILETWPEVKFQVQPFTQQSRQIGILCRIPRFCRNKDFVLFILIVIFYLGPFSNVTFLKRAFLTHQEENQILWGLKLV